MLALRMINPAVPIPTIQFSCVVSLGQRLISRTTGTEHYMDQTAKHTIQISQLVAIGLAN